MQRRLLIAEDNEVNRELLVAILQEDYEVLEARDGVEALEILEKEHEKISAVVLDIVMPQISGLEVLKKVKSDPDMRQLPVIVATGSDGGGSEEEALAMGANDYVRKPYSANILKNRLWNIINLREQAALINATKTDALTGLRSRNAFFEQAAKMIAEQEPGYYVMACFDIERFKVINDQYGNEKGDDVLKYIAKVFENGFEKDGGICCRIMADNFAVLYPTSFSTSDKIKEIRREASRPGGLILPITFSIGRYIVDDLALSPSAMYDRAVIAKETVKGHYDEYIGVYNEAMRNRILEEQGITSEMRQALKKGQFEVWYQPQFNHVTGMLVGAEALVRWRHPDKGLVSPGLFIPIFEKNGFVYEVDKFVWEEACKFLSEMQRMGRIVPISVNISRHDIFREDLVEFISGLIKKYKIPVEALRLEITESAFAKSSTQIIRVVETLKNMGFTMEIDDFGSGYSSLNTLKDVPADVLKLDMRFLEGESNSEKGGNIIESIIRMAKWIGMSVIAEGVEEQEQADFLQSVGCHYIQGYLYSKPLPKSDYVKVISEKSCEEKMETIEKVETYDSEAFWNPKSMETLIFNSFVGGASVFEYYNDKVEIIRVNDKYAKILGGDEVPADEVLQRRWRDYMSEEDLKKSEAAMCEAIRTKNEVKDEMLLENFRGTGKSAYIRATMRVIANAGARYLFYCVLEDMTAQREAEKKEKLIAARLEMVMDNVGCGITATIVEDNSVEYLFANEQYYALLGYTREQYHEEVKDTYSLIWQEDRERVRMDAKRLNQSKESITIDYRVTCRDGSLKWMRLFGSNAKELNGNRVVQLSVFRDVTSDKLVENQIKENARQLQNLNDAITNLIDDTPGGFMQMHYSADGKFVADYINKGFCDFVGMSEDELMSHYCEDIMWNVHEEDIAMVTEAAKKMLKDNHTVKIKYRIRHKNGAYILVTAFGRTTIRQSGEMGINIYFSDISEETKEEEYRRELLDNLPCGAGIYEYANEKLTSVYRNRRYWELVGRGAYELEGHSALNYVQPGDREYLISILEKGIERGGRLEGEIHILHGSGRYVPFLVHGNVIKRTCGKMLLYVTYTPVTEEE